MDVKSYSFLKCFKTIFFAGFLLTSCTNLPIGQPVNQLFPTLDKAYKKQLVDTGTPTPAAVLDVATAQERLAAARQATPSLSKSLGSTIASLGNPAETGFWFKTSLVDRTQPGRIVFKETGKSVNVTLIPLEAHGIGSQVSLSAMRLFGVSLTELLEIKVYPL